MPQAIAVSPTRAPSITAPALATSTSSPSPGSHGRPQTSEESNVNATLGTHTSRTSVLVPPLGQFLLSMLLQAAGLVAAVAFGVFAVQSVNIAKAANKLANNANKIADDANSAADKQAKDASELAMAANRLALIALCLADSPQIADFSSICAPVMEAATTVLPQLAASLFSLYSPSSTSSIATVPPSSGSGGAGAHVGMIAGITIGVLVVLLLLGWLLLFRRHSFKYSSSDLSIDKDRGIVQSFREFFMDTRLITKEESPVSAS